MRNPFIISACTVCHAPSQPGGWLVFLPPAELWRVVTGVATNETFRTILVNIRLPRTALIALVRPPWQGAARAYQGLFRILGDAYLIVWLRAQGSARSLPCLSRCHIPRWVYWLFRLPFIASLVTVYFVYTLAHVGGSVPTTNLILAGVAVSILYHSLTSFLMLRSTGEVRRAIGWLLGGVSLVSWDATFALIPYLLIGLTMLVLTGYALNLLQFGDDQAMQMGLNIGRAKLIIIVAASLVSAAAVSFAGIIGFVGLVVPHIVRIWWGVDYRRLIPLSIIGGAAVLLFADVLARIVLAPRELPVGIVTALAGAPFFLWVLRRSKNQGLW